MTGTVFETHRPVRADAAPIDATALASRFLRVPLLGKLLGANALLFASAVGVHELFPAVSMVAPLWIAFGLSFAVTGGLTWLALRPIADLEATAQRVTAGDFGARVPPSRLADREMQGLSATVNRLLGRVQADRSRIEYLAGRSVRARDIERESIARELRDSFAQMVSAIALQLAAVERLNDHPALQHELDRARVLVTQLAEDMRGAADALHPGTLGELGLANALRSLARRTERASTTVVAVDCALCGAVPLTPQAVSALYRVADEALRNVARHAAAMDAQVRLSASNGDVVVEVVDNGRGVDMRAGDPLESGLGLFSAKAVLALSGGELQISSAPGRGTHVVARVPMRSPTSSA